MPSKLDALRAMTTVVADTGDMEAIGVFKPADCTTNPTLILKAAQMPAYAHLVDEAIVWGKAHHAVASQVTDRLAVNFGAELTRIVPGRVSTEVDADLSFDIDGTVAKARHIIADYAARGVGRERVLIKIAATWEGIQAARILQKENIDCNLTLLFSLTQAAACADAGVFLISPFVGRILDWHLANGMATPATPQDDPGVQSVQRIWRYYKQHGYETVVMGASFRNTGEVLALAGCDRLTISPDLLAALEQSDAAVEPALVDDGTRAAPPARLDEAAFRWQHNEDAMATDKLADGIRKFAVDQRKLESLLAAKLG